MKKHMKIIIIIIILLLFLIVVSIFTLNSRNTNDSDLRNIDVEDAKIISRYFDNILENYSSIKLISGRSNDNTKDIIENYIYIEIPNKDYNYIQGDFSIITKVEKQDKTYCIIRKRTGQGNEESKTVREIFEKYKKNTIIPFKYIDF